MIIAQITLLVLLAALLLSQAPVRRQSEMRLLKMIQENQKRTNILYDAARKQEHHLRELYEDKEMPPEVERRYLEGIERCRLLEDQILELHEAEQQLLRKLK